ncbi:GntR family transcriptional regulator [Burkholderiaceae bacterium DAT-1]|nr:GntR family transcriptional regulator [Burkholderiaceae bacterium DAT-1]
MPITAIRDLYARPERQPLYMQVRQLVLEGIERGEWAAGSLLPSEFELAERFRVSQGTVRKGLDALVGEQVLRRRQGLGTFVAEMESDWGAVCAPMQGRRLEAAIELLSCTRTHASDEIVEMMGLRRAAQMFMIRRLVRAEGEPFAVIDSFVPADRFPDLDARRIRQGGLSLREVWVKEYGVRLFGRSPVYRSLMAGRDDARLLNIGVDRPLLEVLRVAESPDGEALEWCSVRCRTDHFGYMA